jgi:predicted amidohydrolase YtcJ
MQAAMTAVPMCPDCPPQAQNLSDTLHAFTTAGAYMEFMEDRKGMLKDGYLADIAVLDANLEATVNEEIDKVRPQVTICDGRVTFEA